MFAESYGFGGELLVDRSPPIVEIDGSAHRCRELALRLSLEMLSNLSLGPRLHAVFAAGRRDDPHAILSRFLQLVSRLVEEEIPRLRKVLRYKVRTRASWQAEPQGGRVHLVNSLRRAAGGPPILWQVERTDRDAESPVNRLLVLLLRGVAATLDQVRRKFHSERMPGMQHERSRFARGQNALSAFLSASPLSTLPIERTTEERLRQEARRRRIELRRVEPFLRWVDEFRATDLIKLEQLREHRDLSIEAAYELIVTLSLLLALNQRLPLCSGERLRFRAHGGELEAHLAVPLGRRGRRRASLRFDLHPYEGPQRQLLIEARNFGKDAAGHRADDLEAIRERADVETQVLLFVPVAVPDDELIRQCPLDDLASAPLSFWQPTLDEVLRPIEKPR